MDKPNKKRGSKLPLVIIDPELNRFRDVVLFPRKVMKAKETIARLGLPENTKNEKARKEDSEVGKD